MDTQSKKLQEAFSKELGKIKNNQRELKNKITEGIYSRMNEAGEGIKTAEQKDWSSPSLIKATKLQLTAKQASTKWTANYQKR